MTVAPCGQVAGPVAGDHRLDLAQALAARRFEPGRLGAGNGDSRQLANSRVRELAAVQRVCDQRELGDRACDAKALGRRVRRVPHRALHILQQAAEPECAPQLQLLGIAQQVRLFGVERGPPGRNAAELLVHSRPLDLVPALPRSGRGGVICPRACSSWLGRATRHAVSMDFFGNLKLLIQHVAALSALTRIDSSRHEACDAPAALCSVLDQCANENHSSAQNGEFIHVCCELVVCSVNCLYSY